ncbi:MAG: PLP-dependent aspartate aminotransferase family protein [Pseudomonadota bacterium]
MAKALDPKSVGPRTLAVHAGEKPDPTTGSSAPNLVMSSTFVTEKPEGFSAYDLNEDSPFVYGRWQNPTVKSFEDKLAAVEGAEACVAFASGMGAAAAILFSELSSGDHMILSDVSYAGIAELSRDTLPRMGVKVSTVNCSDAANIEAAMRPETKLVFIDTPCNPLLRLTDIAAAARIAHAGGAKLAVDNTFATPIGTNPLGLGADFVMHSTTKYVNGHGDAVGGAVCCSLEAARHLRSEAIVHYGGVLSPFNAWLMARGMATLPIRMRAHEETATALAQMLESHPKVEKVLYPGLPSHPQHNLAATQMKNFSGMLTFRLKGGVAEGQAAAERLAAGLGIVHYAVSLGHHRTLICYMPTDSLLETSFRLEGENAEDYRAYAGDGVFRVSVGLEDAEDLYKDLDALL